MIVQLRQEEKGIDRASVAEAYGISQVTLGRRIGIGKIVRPSGEEHTYTRRDIDHLFEQCGVPSIRIRGRGRAYLESLIQSQLVIVRGGVFLLPFGEPKDKASAYEEEIRRYGLVGAQGMCNHIHLCECGTKNPVLQLILAQQIQDSWIEKVRTLRTRSKVLIEWVGRGDTVICIYLLSKGEEKHRNQLEDARKIQWASVTQIEV